MARKYVRNKLGQFAKGGAISSKSGNGGGAQVSMKAMDLGKEGPSMRAARSSTRSSGGGSVDGSFKIENFEGADKRG